MAPTVSGVAFAILAALCVGGAVGMLVSKNIVHAAFWLLEVTIASAGLFLLLDADYVAIVQLLVYAVAVAILLIFSIMITLRRIEDAVRPRDFSAVAAALSAARRKRAADASRDQTPGKPICAARRVPSTGRAKCRWHRA